MATVHLETKNPVRTNDDSSSHVPIIDSDLIYKASPRYKARYKSNNTRKILQLNVIDEVAKKSEGKLPCIRNREFGRT
jgi:hypothetical protein